MTAGKKKYYAVWFMDPKEQRWDLWGLAAGKKEAARTIKEAGFEFTYTANYQWYIEIVELPYIRRRKK